MGFSKANLPFGPETMLARTVRLLSQATETIVVVAAAGQPLQSLPSHVRVVTDEREGSGPLEGLRSRAGGAWGRGRRRVCHWVRYAAARPGVCPPRDRSIGFARRGRSEDRRSVSSAGRSLSDNARPADRS